ncbi:hypothetical protein, partial [Sphingopyxis sp. 2PD]|uniref:hypothetical protein n=1 Tax=Sphingopyxis sp. 2PD TaxID=2502196 RepID=UPI001BB2C652
SLLPPSHCEIQKLHGLKLISLIEAQKLPKTIFSRVSLEVGRDAMQLVADRHSRPSGQNTMAQEVGFVGTQIPDTINFLWLRPSCRLTRSRPCG